MFDSVGSALGVLSALAGIASLVLFFITLKKTHLLQSLLATAVLMGLPICLFFSNRSVWAFSCAAIAYSAATIILAYMFGRSRANSISAIPDLLHISNQRTSGHDWIVERVRLEGKNAINIDCFGVKVDALYKVIKGTSFRSKLPHDLEIKMRVLLLEADSAGVKCRAELERNDRVASDVALMNGVYAKLSDEYSRHPYHSLSVRTFAFGPCCYMIRVNDQMLIGTYLAESGYDNLCLHLVRRDGKTFGQYERFFERVWTNCSSELTTDQKQRSEKAG